MAGIESTPSSKTSTPSISTTRKSKDSERKQKEHEIAQKEMKKEEKEGKENQSMEQPEVVAIASDEESDSEMVIDEQAKENSHGSART